MPTYKGNVGNLMQHWTLCELLNIANRHYEIPGLNFIEAHAMAPIAHKRTEDNLDRRAPFNVVRAGLPGQLSAYERAWHHLAPRGGYPNSANFVQQVWTRKLSLLLCEKDLHTIGALRSWLPRIQAQPNRRVATVCRCDWRKRFRLGLPTPADAGLPSESLTLVSFDPDLISWHPRPRRLNQEQGRSVYPEDLEEVRGQLAGFDGRVIIQLSTYSAQNNREDLVARMVYDKLARGPNGFDHSATVRVDGHMRSMVYARGLNDDQWTTQLGNLPEHFCCWRNRN